MPFDVDEKDVLPRCRAFGAGLDAREVDAFFVEDFERTFERVK